MNVCQQDDIQSSAETRGLISVPIHTSLAQQTLWNHCLLSAVLLTVGWACSLESETASHNKVSEELGWETQALWKQDSSRMSKPSMRSADVQQRRGVKLYSSHGRTPFRATLHSAQADQVKGSNALCCAEKDLPFFFVCFWLAVPAVPDAGEVYDRYRPGDGIPQQQELHPQRPCCSQLHVSLSPCFTHVSCVPYFLSLCAVADVFKITKRSEFKAG